MTDLDTATPNVQEFVDRFTAELDSFVRERLPVSMDNQEYANGTAGMLMALNRTIATCTVAFGETHGMERKLARAVIHGQFDRYLDIAYEALDQGRGTIQ